MIKWLGVALAAIIVALALLDVRRAAHTNGEPGAGLPRHATGRPLGTMDR